MHLSREHQRADGDDRREGQWHDQGGLELFLQQPTQGLLVREFVSLLVCWSVGMLVCESASLQVCKSASLQVCESV